MTTNELIAIPENVRVIATAKASINSAVTANFDFGTPNDLDLEALAASGDIDAGDRILAVFTGTTSGSDDTLSFSVQDADDNAGSFGTAATAVTDGTLTGGTSDQYAVASVRVQAGRPWLRFRHTSDGTTDTFAVTCTVMAVSRSRV